MKKVLCVLLTAALCVFSADCAELLLAENGKTGYEIVKPAHPTDIDNYAVNELSVFLKGKTGAEFPVVAPEQMATGARHIFIGQSEPAMKIVGKDPLAKLKDQEYIVKTSGEDILLYGEGVHGNLHAVMDFIENTLGRRWYTESDFQESPQWGITLGKPTFIPEKKLSIQPFERKGGFSFAYREPVFPKQFHYQHGLNLGFSEANRDNRFPPGVVSLKYMPSLCHTLFGYIPPSQEEQADKRVFGWVPKKDYFKTNPEFFSQNKEGKRVPLQLCFSNPELRKELTKNVMEHIRLLKEQRKEDLLINISAMDNPPEFCHCPGCQALKKKYGSPGGPIYDYLFELCPAVKGKYPDVMLHTLAYRLSQTQKPPVMPAGQKFPDNLTVTFANVHDDADKDWNNPVNKPSYEDLLAWCKIAPHVWTWYYPFSPCMPCGNIERLVTDLRLMKKAKVEGVGLEFMANDYSAGDNFSELQRYLYVKLLKDINSDVPALIKEFTDYQYGGAAPLVRTYLQELEEAQKAASGDTTLAAGRGYTRKLTLPAESFRRWHDYLDKMEKTVAADQRCLKNIRRLRRTLDLATLSRWADLSKAYPDYFKDYGVIKKRLAPLPPFYVQMVEDWEMMIKVAGREKPLPAQFDGIDKALVKRLVPTRKRGNPKIVTDSEAAFGYGAVVNLPNKPFSFGFWQKGTDNVITVKLDEKEVKNGVYQLWRLGEIQVTPDCIVWFGGSWETNLQLGDRLYSPPSPVNDNRYDAYVSLKFDKPIPPTPEEIARNDKYSLNVNDPYSVLCDQIIFVKKEPIK